MATIYSQWIWGFEIFDASGPSPQNNLLVFSRSGPGQVTATLTAGVYTVDEFKNHVATSMNAVDNAGYRCDFDYNTLKFTIDDNGGPNFQLLFSGQNGVSSPAALLGFTSDTSLGNSFISPNAAGILSGGAGAWTAAEPLVMTSPVTAHAAGVPAELTRRSLKTVQHISDGGSVESIYISTLKSIQVAFRTLLPAEQQKMELFLDWAVTGKRFTWQPDKTSSNLLKLVLANPSQINNSFEWLTRSETGYGVLTFYEQLS